MSSQVIDIQVSMAYSLNFSCLQVLGLGAMLGRAHPPCLFRSSKRCDSRRDRHYVMIREYAKEKKMYSLYHVPIHALPKSIANCTLSVKTKAEYPKNGQEEKYRTTTYRLPTNPKGFVLSAPAAISVAFEWPSTRRANRHHHLHQHPLEKTQEKSGN
jgi:hypothetical protein